MVLPLCFDKTPIIKSERKVDEIAHFGNVFIWREVVLIKKFKKKIESALLLQKCVKRKYS